jgi:hypothetical protein
VDFELTVIGRAEWVGRLKGRAASRLSGVANPMDVCANPACKHYRFQHEGGPCQEWKGTDATGKNKVKCDCPGFMEPKKS